MQSQQISTSPDRLHPPYELSRPVPRRRLDGYGWMALVTVGPLFLLILRIFPALDQAVFHDALGHVLIVGGASALGVILALLTLHVAWRAQDSRVFLIGLGFLCIASIFFIHAISTPDVLMSGRSLATRVSAILSLVLGGAVFALSGLSLSDAINRRLMRAAQLVLGIYLAFWLAYSWAFLVLIPSLPTPVTAGGATAHQAAHQQATRSTKADYDTYDAYDAKPGVIDVPAQSVEPQLQLTALPDVLQTPLAMIGLGCYAFATARHFVFYRRSPSQAGRAITCGIVLFGEALLAQQFAQVYMSTFWLYHAQEFIGFGVISYAVLGAYRRGQIGEGLLESLFLSGTRARLQASYASAMDSLVQMLSRGEQPTPALRNALHMRFGLSETQIQTLEGAAAAVAHERRQRQELERLNAALYKLEQHKTELSQMIVHDLKNPLTALVGFLEMLRMSDLNDDQHLLVENALRSGKNLAGLIGDLLDIARMEEGHMELELSSVAPYAFLNECADEMRGWITQSDKTIAVEVPLDLPHLSVDVRLLRRVLLNLISNAIKHTPLGTQIMLRAYVAPTQSLLVARQGATSELIVELEDNGPGIPAEHLTRIFEKFGRFSSECHARQDSTGLGLTFCQLAIEAHGGLMSVSSVIGQGTTFRVVLPGI